MNWLYAASALVLAAVIAVTRVHRRHGRRRRLTVTVQWSDETEDKPDDDAAR